MKNILLITVLLAAISCTYSDREVKLSFNVDTEITNIGKNKGIDLLVFDDRASRRYLGQKILGDQKVNISADDNVAEFLKAKFTKNLLLKGFKVGGDKEVEVHLKLLKFKAKRGVPIGNSRAQVVVRVIVNDNLFGDSFSKEYNLGLKNDYFISSLQSSDEKVINELLRELVKDILEDDVLLENLSR